MKDLVIINSKKQAVTSSRILAGKFNKQHKMILTKIEDLKTRNKNVFNELKIRPVKYKDAKGEMRKEFILNRDAYAFIAMGLTGKDADQFKLDFIQAFNEMESWIKDRLQASIEYKVMSATLHDARAIHGKTTSNFHYANEAKLVNWALTGEFKPLDRESLPSTEISLLNELQTRNAVLIGAGMTRDNRKQALTMYVELKQAA